MSSHCTQREDPKTEAEQYPEKFEVLTPAPVEHKVILGDGVVIYIKE